MHQARRRKRSEEIFSFEFWQRKSHATLNWREARLARALRFSGVRFSSRAYSLLVDCLIFDANDSNFLLRSTIVSSVTMHIKQITISNFRSFRQQPEIDAFSAATNAVVGRNGSGKSNLFDAVQFCLLAPRFVNLRQVRRNPYHGHGPFYFSRERK